MKRIKCILFFIFAFCFSMIMPLFCFAAITEDDVIDYEQFLVNQYVEGEYLVGVFDIPLSYSKFTVTYPTGETYNMSNSFRGNLKWDEPNPYFFDVYPIGDYYFDATDIPDGTYIVYNYSFDNEGSNADGLEHGKIGFSFGFTASARVFNSSGTLLQPNDMYTGMDTMSLYGDFSARTFFNKPDGSKYFQPFISVSLNAPDSIVGTGVRYPFRFKLKTISIMFSMNDITSEDIVANKLLSAILNGYIEQQDKANSTVDSYDDFFSMVEDIRNNGGNVTFPSIEDINSVVDNFGEFITPDEMELYVNVFQPLYDSPFIVILIFTSAIFTLVSIILLGKR